MEIKYLKSLENYKGNATFYKKGISIEEIEKLEQEFNNGDKFPIAYREYLFLAGDTNALYLDEGNGHKWMQETSKNNIEEYNLDIGRPFWVISQVDNCMQFSFIYLDELEDNPKVYICYVDYIEDFIAPIKQGNLIDLIETYLIAAISDANYLDFDKE